MPNIEILPTAAGILRGEISGFEETRDLLPADSHVRALFEITIEHLEICAAHLERSICGAAQRPGARSDGPNTAT